MGMYRSLRALILGSALTACSLGAQQTGRGFLFVEPKGSFALRGGLAIPAATGDLLGFTSTQLTLDRADFRGAVGEAEVSWHIGSRSDVVVGTSIASAARASEFRDFVDDAGNAIRQRTEFVRVPVLFGFRQYLFRRGRSIGTFAWIPTRLNPYAVGSAGLAWYRFRQTGDFVDFETNDIFEGTLESMGWAPAAGAGGGADYSLSPRLALTAQGMYQWSRARPRNDFSGFKRMDLSGLSSTVGLKLRF